MLDSNLQSEHGATPLCDFRHGTQHTVSLRKTGGKSKKAGATELTTLWKTKGIYCYRSMSQFGDHSFQHYPPPLPYAGGSKVLTLVDMSHRSTCLHDRPHQAFGSTRQTCIPVSNTFTMGGVTHGNVHCTFLRTFRFSIYTTAKSRIFYHRFCCEKTKHRKCSH